MADFDDAVPMPVGSRTSRRTMLKMGLGAGAGFALWELYRSLFGGMPEQGARAIVDLNNIGFDDDLLTRLVEVALGNKAEYADIYLEYSVSTYMNFDGDRLQNAGVELVSGGAIRAIAGGRAAFRAVEDLTPEGLRQAARDVSATAGAGGGAKLSGMSKPGVAGLYDVASPAMLEPLKAKQSYILRMIDAARGASPHVQVVRAAYRDTLRFILVATSTGVVARDSQPLLNASISVAAGNQETGRHGVGFFSGGGHYGLEWFNEHPPEALAKRAVEIAEHQLDGKDVRSGELPVVLGPAYGGILMHEAVGHGLEADPDMGGFSTYPGRVGQIVASPIVTIYDDGRRPNLNGSINFDDEGVESRMTALIDRGRLAGFMHTRETAAAMGVAPTGNGRRQGFGFPPLPRMTNTYLAAGDAEPDEIIRSVDFGIYARSFSGGSVNTTTGDFNFEPTEAYLIESGRMTAPLSNVLLIGNGPEVLRRISMVGSDLQISDNLWDCGKMGQFVPVTVGTPTVKIDALTVGGTGH